MTDKLQIDQVINLFFSIFTNTDRRQPNCELIRTLCLPETIIIKKNDLSGEIYDLQRFIDQRKLMLSDGTLTEFEESETEEETHIAGCIAQRSSKYKKSGYLNGNYFQGIGNKFFQCVKTHEGWKINSLIWEDDKN